MRDIRGDLEERARAIDDQVGAAYAWFDKVAQELQRERDAKVAELNETLATINKVMQLENAAMDKVVTLENPSTHPSLAQRIRATGT